MEKIRLGLVGCGNMMGHHQPGVEENRGYRVIWSGDAIGGKHTNLETAHFLDCIRTGKRPMTDARRALQSLRIIWKMYDAEKAGTVADLRGLGLENA